MSAPFDEDGVDLLTSRLAPERAELARRLTTALRLMASDAMGEGSPSAVVHPASAASEFAERRTRILIDALFDVVDHLLRSAIPLGSFLQVARPVRSYSNAWRVVLRLCPAPDRERLALDLPLPGTPVSEALAGALDAAGAFAEALDDDVVRLCVEHGRLRAGLVAGAPVTRETRRAFDDLARELHALPRPAAHARRRAVLVDGLALALDGRRIRDVEPLLARLEPLPGALAECADAQDALVLIARWIVRRDLAFPRLASDRADELGVMLDAWDEVAELHRAGGPSTVPAVARDHDAMAEPARGGATSAGSATLDRRAVGARAVLVCAIDPVSGRVRVVGADCAPGLSGELDPWLARRRDALLERGSPEHEVVRRAEPVAWCAGGDGAARVLEVATLGAGPSRASGRSDLAPPAGLVLLPLLDRRSEARGFVWVECDHDLLPGPLHRAQLVRAGAALLDRAGARERRAGEPRDVAAAQDDVWDVLGADADLARRWTKAVAGLQLKLVERRWVAFHRVQEPRRQHRFTVGDAPTIRPVAAGGEGELGAAAPGLSNFVERAFRTGGTIRYGTGGVFVGTQSGVALPVRVGEHVFAVLSIESARRGDARDKDVARWDATLTEAAGRIALAAVDARDRRASFGGIALDVDDPGSPLALERLVGLAEVRSDLCVIGDEGSGRATLARTVGHLAQIGAGAGLVRVIASSGLDAGGIERRLEGEAEDVLVLEAAERLASPVVAAIREWARARAVRPRLVATAVGPRQPELGRALGAATLRLPPLAQRRNTIVPIARALLRRVARQSGCGAAVGLTDEAAALLWRQPWPGHCAELASVLNTAFVHRLGDRIGAGTIEEALVENGLEPVLRLPSREPAVRDLALAVWWTRTATRRINKTRASAYLGWDPATLTARLQELGVTDLDAAFAKLGE